MSKSDPAFHVTTPGERLARDRFERHMARLRQESRAGSPRQNLEAGIRVCDDLLEQAGQGRIVELYRAELTAFRKSIMWCHLRVVRCYCR